MLQTKPANPNSLPSRLTLLMVSMLTVMSGATISPALPTMQEHFQDVPNVDYLVRLALTLPALLIAIAAPLVGILIDRYGRKPLLLISLALYALAGSSGFVLNDLGLILVGRALLGISVAGIMTIATTLIADYYSGPVRVNFLGLQAGFMGLGGVVFLSLGGFLADLSWRSPFLIYLMSVVLIPCAWVALPEPQRLVANPTAQGGSTALPTSMARLVGITYGIAIVTQIVFYLMPVQIPFYLKQIANASGSQSGLALALLTLFSAAASISFRYIKARLSFTAIYGVAFINMALGYGIVGLATSYAVALVGLAISGAGLGLLMPNMNLCLTSTTPDTLRGRVVSGITTSMFLGQFLSPFVSQPLSLAVGLSSVYGLAAGLMLILSGFILMLILRSQP
jgi:MFS family permease